jgi:hypothetical protein
VDKKRWVDAQKKVLAVRVVDLKYVYNLPLLEGG